MCRAIAPKFLFLSWNKFQNWQKMVSDQIRLRSIFSLGQPQLLSRDSLHECGTKKWTFHIWFEILKCVKNSFWDYPTNPSPHLTFVPFNFCPALTKQPPSPCQRYVIYEPPLILKKCWENLWHPKLNFLTFFFLKVIEETVVKIIYYLNC